MSSIQEFAADVARDINRIDRELAYVKSRLVSGQVQFGAMNEIQIAAGVIPTLPWNYYELEPQTGTADDLDTINGGIDGKMIGIRTNSNANTITVKDGTGNICLPDGDVDLDDVCLVMLLIYDADSSKWLAAGGTGGGGGAATFLALTDAPASYASQGLKLVRVNTGETALEFVDPSTVAGSSREIFDFLNSTKTSADTPDDEFDGTLAKWTVVNGGSGTIDFLEAGDVAKYELDTTNDVLMMQTGDLATNEVDMRQDWTLGDGESIILAITPAHEWQGSTSSNNEHQGGIALNDTDTGHRDGNYMWIGFDVDASKGFTAVSYDGSTLVVAALDAGHASETLFFRILRDGSNYHAYVSTSGLTWTRLGTYTGTTYDNLWIWNRCGSTAMNPPIPVTIFHWVRQGANTLNPWSPLISIPTFPGVLNFGGMETLTISTGVVTKTATTSFFNIAAESGTADDLVTINGGSDGDMIVLRPDSGDTITVKDNTGNIQLNSDFAMDNPADKIMLIYDDAISKWCEASDRSSNA